MKKRNENKDEDRMDIIPKELQKLSRGVLQELEDEEPELVKQTGIDVINDLIRQELSRVMGLDLVEPIRESKTTTMKFSDIASAYRRFLLSQSREMRAKLFKPLANEMGYYTWEQFVHKLNTIQQATKGSVK